MARLTRSERLGKQGIVFFEVDGVLARLTKAQSAAPSKFANAVEAVSVMTPLALQMRKRVRDERKLASGVWGGYGRRASVLLSEQYATAAGLSRKYWPHSAAMHGNLKNGNKLFSVTGKMWESMQVRGMRQDRAVIDFQGSSVGRGVVVKRRTVKGVITLKNVPETVRNQSKANSIFSRSKINILEPTDQELEACAVEVIMYSKQGLEATWGAVPSGSSTPAAFSEMAAMIRANLSKG